MPSLSLAFTEEQAERLEELGKRKRLMAKLLVGVIAHVDKLLAVVRRLEVA